MVLLQTVEVDGPGNYTVEADPSRPGHHLLTDTHMTNSDRENS